MKFKHHLLIGLFASFAFTRIFDLSFSTGLIIFFASWIIDFDHYLWYGFEMKNWNPLCAIKWYIKSIPKWHALPPTKKEKFKRGVFVFHGVLFWAILVSLSFIYNLFFWILIGVGIHMVTDWIDLTMKNEPLYNKIFPLYTIQTNKDKKGLKEL